MDLSDVQSDLSTRWDIYLDISSIPSLVGSNKTIGNIVVFYSSNDSTCDDNGIQKTFFAYESLLVGGVDLDASNSLVKLLGSLEEIGYTLSVYYADDTTPITVTSSTKASTGMKIVERQEGTNNIVKVYHVVVLGDVQGDGYVDNTDASIIISYDAGLGTLTGAYVVAADANQDGTPGNEDASLVLKYDAGLANISQVLASADVPNDVYFGTPVAFNTST